MVDIGIFLLFSMSGGKSPGNTMGVYVMGEFSGLNGLMLSDSPYDIHNLCGDYTETTIITIIII